MSDVIEKAILIGTGVEKKLKDILKEFEESGKKERGGAGVPTPSGVGRAELPPSQSFQNRLVEEASKAVKDILSVLKDSRAKVEGEVSSAAESIADKLGLATKDDLEVVKEMARVAREKVDALEKRLEAMEHKGKGK